MSQSRIDGGCLCGAVQYQVRPGCRAVYNVICHCPNCRRATGTAFATNGIYLKTDITLTRDHSHALRAYTDTATDSGTPLIRQFCSRCGSPLFALTALAPQIVSIYSGSLTEANRRRLVEGEEGGKGAEGNGGGGGGGPLFKEQYVECRKAWLPQFDADVIASIHARGCHTFSPEEIKKAGMGTDTVEGMSMNTSVGTTDSSTGFE